DVSVAPHSISSPPKVVYYVIISRCTVCYFFFFFQAEDGIRDLTVTGVQTCALPICAFAVSSMLRCCTSRSTKTSRYFSPKDASRSEERRVGKECRYRWSPEH